VPVGKGIGIRGEALRTGRTIQAEERKGWVTCASSLYLIVHRGRGKLKFLGSEVARGGGKEGVSGLAYCSFGCGRETKGGGGLESWVGRNL